MMRRALTLISSAAIFLLVEGCYLGGAVRRAVTGEPPDPAADGATAEVASALYVTTYAVLRELAGLATNYLKTKFPKAEDVK